MNQALALLKADEAEFGLENYYQGYLFPGLVLVTDDVQSYGDWTYTSLSVYRHPDSGDVAGVLSEHGATEEQDGGDIDEPRIVEVVISEVPRYVVKDA